MGLREVQDPPWALADMQLLCGPFLQDCPTGRQPGPGPAQQTHGRCAVSLLIWSAISGRLWGHLAVEDRPLRTVLCASLIPSPDEKSLPQVLRGESVC